MSDHFVPFEALRRGVEYELTLDDDETMIATFDGYAPAFGTNPDMGKAKDFARFRDSEGRQHSLPREQIESIKVV